jgi:cobyrinic acid a,c-diamide synthase
VGARTSISQLALGEIPAKRLCRSLGDALLRRLDLESLMTIATSRESPPVCTCHFEPCQKLAEVTVAVAYDEAFYCYFPDTLDLLELQGATIKTFSPLRDEQLPPDTSVVYIGCGHPEQWLEPLAENQCIWSALRKHVIAGGRLYAEGGGLAYLCEGIELADGSLRPMVGVLPAVARHVSVAAKPRPVELTLAQGNWLGEGWSRLRGYLHNRWDLQPTGPLRCYAAQEGHELDIVGHRQAIGSRIHLNFAAQPEFLRAFFSPHACEARVPVM